MILEQLKAILDTTGLPVAYLAFPADSTPAMPFVCYQELGSRNMGADNTVWHSATRVQIDLLTSRKDRTTEQLLENKLTEACIFWERVPDYDSANDYYRVTYEAEI